MNFFLLLFIFTESHDIYPTFLSSRSYFLLENLASCTQWTCDSLHHTIHPYSVYKKVWSYLVYRQMKFWLRHCWRCRMMQQAVHSWIVKVATQACWYCQNFCKDFGIAMSSLQIGFEDSWKAETIIEALSSSCSNLEFSYYQIWLVAFGSAPTKPMLSLWA